MKEHSGRVTRVNLDGEDGCAEVDVRCKVSIADARRLSKLMLAEGSPIRVLFPEEPVAIVGETKGRDPREYRTDFEDCG